MSDWDFLWGLEGKELEEAIASGGTRADWEYIYEQERKRYEVNKETINKSDGYLE